jgi:hypothetical protein
MGRTSMLSNHRIRLRGELAFAFVVYASLVLPEQVDGRAPETGVPSPSSATPMTIPATRESSGLKVTKVTRLTGGAEQLPREWPALATMAPIGQVYAGMAFSRGSALGPR